MESTMQVLSSLLALVAGAGALLLLVALVVGDRVPVIGSIAAALRRRHTEWTFAIAGFATAGSLYFSEVAEYTPCRLCWFQRIFMYPIALIALVALVRRERHSHWYTVPLASIGAVIAGYHYLIERGVFADTASCARIGVPCAAVWFERFGFVTLAFMALCGFAAIIALNVAPRNGAALSEEDL